MEASKGEDEELLDEELQRLPNKYRLPLLLFYFEGLTREEAAAQLGWTEAKVKGLLDRGRQLLRFRLIRRGLTLSATTSATLLTDTALTAAVPRALAVATIQAALNVVSGQKLTACGVSAGVAILAKGELMMGAKKMLLILALAFLTGTIAVSAGVWAGTRRVQPSPITATGNPTQNETGQEQAKEKIKQKVKDVGGKKKAQELILGKWQAETEPDIVLAMEFHKDGNFKLISKIGALDLSREGKYKVIDDNTLEIVVAIKNSEEGLRKEWRIETLTEKQLIISADGKTEKLDAESDLSSIVYACSARVGFDCGEAGRHWVAGSEHGCDGPASCQPRHPLFAGSPPRLASELILLRQAPAT